MVTPKLLQAIEMLSTLSCMSCSVLARSSSKRSLMALSLNFVTACKHHWLNSFQTKPLPFLNACITVSECMVLLGRKHHAEQCLSKHATLFDTIGYWEEVCLFATITNTGSYALVGCCNELGRAADLGYYPPEPFSADCVEGLRQALVMKAV